MYTTYTQIRITYLHNIQYMIIVFSQILERLADPGTFDYTVNNKIVAFCGTCTYFPSPYFFKTPHIIRYKNITRTASSIVFNNCCKFLISLQVFCNVSRYNRRLHLRLCCSERRRRKNRRRRKKGNYKGSHYLKLRFLLT